MRVVARMARNSRTMVELWRAGHLFSVVHFKLFEDRDEDPENTLIGRLAEGKIVHLDLTFHSEVQPQDGSQQTLDLPPTQAAEGS